MENKIERVDAEKVFCYNFDSLVSELSKKMVVREEVLVPENGEVAIGGHESIFNWIKAIDFEGGKTPAIEATFSSDGGKNTVTVDTEKQTPVGSLDEKVSKEQLLYSMALTEAKMKVVSAIAEEVYPAVAFQISDYRKEMGKMRDEILENKSQTSNFNEVMHGALSRKNVVSAVVIATMLTSSTGCVVATGTAKPIEPTTSPAMTETFIPPTVTGTENPTAAAVTVIPNVTATETQIPTVMATENAPSDFIKINMDNIIYPPVGFVKENFEKGEYDASMETIKKWVSVWGEMGIFKGLEIENKGLNPVPLDGRARIVCVDTRKKGEFVGAMFCPPVDLINGGLKVVPEGGKWNDSDKPLSIIFQGTEELITKGSGFDLAYQFVDKYTKNPTRYMDPKTGLILEGEYQVPGGEIKLPEIVPESMNQIEELSFNMEFKNPKTIYNMLLERVVGDNLGNQQFWQETVGISNPTIDQLLSYARNNVGGPENKAYWLPFTTESTTKFNYVSPQGRVVNIVKFNPKTEGVYIDGMYSLFVSGSDFEDISKLDFLHTLRTDNNEIGIKLIDRQASSIPYDEFGLLFLNNRFLYMSGGEGRPNGGPWGDNFIGGLGGNFREEKDPMIITAQFLSYIKGISNYQYSINTNTGGLVCTYNKDECPGGVVIDEITPEMILVNPTNK